MACMNDWSEYTFRCGYQPCQHEGKVTLHKDDHVYGVRKCPVCGVWNFRFENKLISLLEAAYGRPENKLKDALKKFVSKIDEGS